MVFGNCIWMLHESGAILGIDINLIDLNWDDPPPPPHYCVLHRLLLITETMGFILTPHLHLICISLV